MKRMIIICLLACLGFSTHAAKGYYISVYDQEEQPAKDSTVKDTSATIILKNISHSNFAYCVAVVRGQVISTRNLRPGRSQSFKVPLPGTSLYRFKISLDPEEEYTYSIEPIDYVSQVSSEEIGPGTYEYLIDYDKKQDVISVKLVKVN